MSVADSLSRAVNAGQAKPKDFAASVTNDHRALQEMMFALFLECIKEWANDYDNGYYDLRNEFTVKASKRMVEALQDDTYVPLI